MNNQIKAGDVKRVVDIEPVEYHWPLLPALAGLYRALVMNQTNVIFPFIVHHKRRGVDQHFVKTIQPFDPQLKHRQAKEQSDTRCF